MSHARHIAELQYNLASVQNFDELLLVKLGGRVIYHGKIGIQSQQLVSYFSVSVPKNLDWMTWSKPSSVDTKHKVYKEHKLRKCCTILLYNPGRSSFSLCVSFHSMWLRQTSQSGSIAVSLPESPKSLRKSGKFMYCSTVSWELHHLQKRSSCIDCQICRSLELRLCRRFQVYLSWQRG